MGGRLETADRWGRWDNQRESGHGGGGGRERHRQLWPTGQREGAVRLGPTGGVRLSGTRGARLRLG
jgi:hypothetical protein